MGNLPGPRFFVIHPQFSATIQAPVVHIERWRCLENALVDAFNRIETDQKLVIAGCSHYETDYNRQLQKI